MGTVHIDITLKNLEDCMDANRKRIEEYEIRQATVTAVADTGALYMVLPEKLAASLGLEAKGEKTAHIANGQRVSCPFIPAVEVQWKDREAVVQAVIIPGSEKILFGALAMEAMDLMVDPVRQQVVGAHGDKEEILALYHYFK